MLRLVHLGTHAFVPKVTASTEATTELGRLRSVEGWIGLSDSNVLLTQGLGSSDRFDPSTFMEHGK
jgi:hypothetical protein